MGTRILILAANPKNTTKLRLDEEVREIELGLERSKDRKSFELKSVLASRPVDVRRAMLDFDPTVVHFCGHGAGIDGIALEDNDGNARLVTARALAGFFELFSDKVRYVILNACYSAQQAEAIVQHVDYVIGMKKGIDDAAAIEFSVALYDALGAGRNIHFAYSLACNALMWRESDASLIPILKEKYKQNPSALTKHQEITNENIDNSEDVEEIPYDDRLNELSTINMTNQSGFNKNGRSLEKADVPERMISTLGAGFSLAFCAAFFWGVGNAVTKWSADRFPSAVFEFSFLKYLVAASFLFVIAFIHRCATGRSIKTFKFLIGTDMRILFAAALVKGLNIYFWILSSTLSSASLTATLENMHVIWTALILFLILGYKLPKNWFVSSVVICLGAILISNLDTAEIRHENVVGIMFGILSGLCFSIFGVLWSLKKNDPNEIWQRAIEMSVLLGIGAIMIFPFHLLVNVLWLDGPWIPFTEVGRLDLAIQSLNGAIGIGVTYFLINESLLQLKQFSRGSSLLLGLALSFAVPITMAAELALLDETVILTQGIGVALFVSGYTVLRGNLVDIKK